MKGIGIRQNNGKCPLREMTENVRTGAELVFNQIEREELADITLTLGNIDSPYYRDKPGVALLTI